MEPGRHKFRSARRGLTFVETVCAVAILGMVAAAVFGAFNGMMSVQERQRHRLGAMELANRLILQYLDDKDTMPQEGLPIVYADERYHWDLKEIPVQLIPARADVAEDRTSASAVSVNRLLAITVKVWLSEESGGTGSYDPAIPSANITRLMDPIALRNPDTTNNLAHSAIKQRELLERFQKIGRNTGGGKPKPATTGNASTPNAPAQPAPAPPAPPARGPKPPPPRNPTRSKQGLPAPAPMQQLQPMSPD